MNTKVCSPCGPLRREVIRIVLERIQGCTQEIALKEQPMEPDSEARYEVEEMLNNPYMNRGEIPLAMDIFKPVVEEPMELPVIVTIHGGAGILSLFRGVPSCAPCEPGRAA